MFWPELLATTLYGRIPKIHIFHSAFVCHHFLGGKCLESIFFQQIIKYLNPNMMNYKQSSLKHRFVKQNQTSNPFETSPKSQNIEPISMPEIGWIQDQIWKNWTTNPARFLLYQNLNKISHSSLTYRSVAKAPGENQPIFCFVLHGRTPSNRPIATVELQNSTWKKIL